MQEIEICCIEDTLFL